MYPVKNTKSKCDDMTERHSGLKRKPTVTKGARTCKLNATLLSEGVKVIDEPEFGGQEYYCDICLLTIQFSFSDNALKHCQGKRHLRIKQKEVGIAVAEGGLQIIDKIHSCSICGINFGMYLSEAMKHYREEHKIRTETEDSINNNNPSNNSGDIHDIHAEILSEGLKVIDDMQYGGQQYYCDTCNIAIPLTQVRRALKHCNSRGHVKKKRHEVDNVANPLSEGLNEIHKNVSYCKTCNITLPIGISYSFHYQGRKHIKKTRYRVNREIKLLIAHGGISFGERRDLCYCKICRRNIGSGYYEALDHFKNLHKKHFEKMVPQPCFSKRYRKDKSKDKEGRDFAATSSSANSSQTNNKTRRSGTHCSENSDADAIDMGIQVKQEVKEEDYGDIQVKQEVEEKDYRDIQVKQEVKEEDFGDSESDFEVEEENGLENTVDGNSCMDANVNTKQEEEGGWLIYSTYGMNY